MKSKLRLALIVFAVACCGSAAIADSGIPWVGSITTPNAAEVSLHILPDGSGFPLTEARLQGGLPTDATITVVLIDFEGFPIANFPFEDIWLAADTTTEHPCVTRGFLADSNTDANGRTTFAAPLTGGGWTEGPVWVYLNGTRATHPQTGEHPPVPMRFNSTDINGDGASNMVDVVLFAGDFHGPYHYRSDFQWDGVINLSDVVEMIKGLGRFCP